MALKGKVETELEIKATPEKYYNVFKSQGYHVPNIAPNHIQGVELHEGDWETHGSIKLWNYTVEGKAEIFKEKVELDDSNKTITFVGLEGDVMKHFKTFKSIYKATPKGDECLLKVSIEYEKLNENVATPTIYIDFLVKLAKDIDAHCLKRSVC